MISKKVEKRKTVFWTGLVEVGKIYTYSPLLPFLGGGEDVGEAVWVV